MSWWGALQEVGKRSSGIRNKVKEHARTIAAKTLALEESVAAGLQGVQSARDVELRLEHDARRLAHPTQAAEIVLRWVLLLRASPQHVYLEVQIPDERSRRAGRSDTPIAFRQLFLRCRALELAVDAAVRSPDLRRALRENILPPPESWPDERTPPVAFAFAFTSLLQLTVGPPKAWLSLVGALLSSAEGPSDDQCHAWLLQLLAGSRIGWQDATIFDHEQEVEGLEDAAKHVPGADQPPIETESVCLVALLTAASQQSRVAKASYRAWCMRSKLLEEAERAAKRQEARTRAHVKAANDVAVAAAAKAQQLGEDLANQTVESEDIKKDLQDRGAMLRGEMEALEPVMQQLEREIEQTETTHRELLRQVGQLSSDLEKLRARRAEAASKSDRFRLELGQVEGQFMVRATKDEDFSCKVAKSRALATAVSDIAKTVASGAAATTCGSSSSDTPGACASPDTEAEVFPLPFMVDAARCREASEAASLSLGEKEVQRLRLVARAAKVCADVAEDREKSREAMKKLGVPATTLESDVVGEAEIAQSIQDAIAEIDAMRPETEQLILSLEGGRKSSSFSSVPSEPGSSSPASSSRGQTPKPEQDEARSAVAEVQEEPGFAEVAPGASPDDGSLGQDSRRKILAKELRQCLLECDEKRSRLEVLQTDLEARSPDDGFNIVEMAVDDPFLLNPIEGKPSEDLSVTAPAP